MMDELFALWQSAPWLVAGGALVLVNVVLLLLRITKKLIALAIGVALLAIGLYTGVIAPPAELLALPVWPL